MYVIMAPLQIKEGHREGYIEATVDMARDTVRDQPGCVRFDVIQDGADPNRVWLYEVYTDEAAFQFQLEQPPVLKWREIVNDWQDERTQGAARGSYSIWPPDEDWR